MKIDEEIQKALGAAITGCVRSESIEELRFNQGKINILEWMLNETPDAFSDDKPIEVKQE